MAYLYRADQRLERVKGIEPSYSAWKAAALPLSYTRLITHQSMSAPATSYIFQHADGGGSWI